MSGFMRLGLAMAIGLAVFSFRPAESRAEGAPEIRGVDLMVLGAAGGGHPDRLGVFLAARLRRVPETPLGIEVGLFVPWGVGANLLIDVFRNDRLRVTLLNPGVFYSWTPELRVTRPDVERSVDITVGVGLEWRLAPRLWLTFDSRFFFGEPVGVVGHYGDFARRIYVDMAKGVQTWIGIGYEF